jgi:hypothetical protein
MVPIILAAFIQAPPAPQPKQPQSTSRSPIVLIGCIDLPKFKVTSSDLGVPPTLRLHGKKAVTAMLKEHNGHGDELTGLLKENGRAMGGTKEKKVGDKTRIYVGARSETTTSDVVEEPTFEVQSLKHLGNPCK